VSGCPLEDVEAIMALWRSLESKRIFKQFDIHAKENYSTLVKFKQVLTITSKLEKPTKVILEVQKFTRSKDQFSLSEGLFYLSETMDYFKK
jgi:hypothetical protein